MESGFEFSKRLTNNARDALWYGEMLARNSGEKVIGTEYLLLGILSQEQSAAAKILTEQGVNFENIKQKLAISANKNTTATQTIDLSEAVKLVIRMSIELAHELDQDYCGTEHFLFSLLSQKDSRAVQVLKDSSVDLAEVLRQIEAVLQESQHSEGDLANEAVGVRGSRRGGRGSVLNRFGINLTAKASKNELDPVIGRKKEITRLITILSRRSKNNPVLIGEPGVGKTAIVEGLAQKIANNDVPNHLANKQVYQLDLAAMLAGTKFRGDFEERIKRVLAEVRANKNLIVFIDEIHLLMGAGSGGSDGAMDAANILKPALARGEIRLIGATTLDEYRRYIEKDAALTRRLQSIMVDEPSLSDTVKIIDGLKEKYENHHNVKLTTSVIKEAVRLADRYISERFMPDKAIDVIDEAAASLRVRENNSGENDLKDYHLEKSKLETKINEAVEREDYQAAALYKMQLSRLKEKISATNEKISEAGRIKLSFDDVAQAVSTIAGVPVASLKRSEASQLLKLEKHLKKSIIGQDEAVEKVAKAIRRARSGINDGKRPIGSFVFLGPTGVGKTELARVVAREIFGSDKSLIKIDMSEFAEKHNTSRLVGAPAGYVGYDDGGQLTDRVRRQPYSVVLFDEIEKAHPSVFNILLQILEDGVLTDGQGREIDFTNTVIILTSNLGSEVLSKENGLGFGAERSSADFAQTEAIAKKALGDKMRPELINRFDEIIVFRELGKNEVGQIFDNMIEDLNQRLAYKGIALEVEPSAKRQIIKDGYSRKFGVRPLRRSIQDRLEVDLAEGILAKKFKKGDVVKVRSNKKQLAFSVEKE